MNRGKQSVKKGIWRLSGRYKKKQKTRKQKCGAIPIGLIASLVGPILGNVAKPIFKKIIGRGRRKRKW